MTTSEVPPMFDATGGRRSRRVKDLRVDRVRNQVDAIGIDVEYLLALLHVEFRDRGDRVRAPNGPLAEGGVVEFLLQPELGAGPLVEFGLPDIGGAMNVKDERDAGEAGSQRGLVGREKDVGVRMDDIDGTSHQSGQDIRHRVDAKGEPVAAARLDPDVVAHRLSGGGAGGPGSQEIHSVSPFLE